MKKAVSILLATVLCMILLTACGQTPVSPDGSVPQDTSATTTEETTTTTTTTEETTTTTAETTTTAKPTTNTKKPTTVKPTTHPTTKPTTAQIITVTSATVPESGAPSARKRYFAVQLDGKSVAFAYQRSEYVTVGGEQEIVWVYTATDREGKRLTCQVDGVLESIRSIGYAEDPSNCESFEMEELSAYCPEMLSKYGMGWVDKPNTSLDEEPTAENGKDKKGTIGYVTVVVKDSIEQVRYQWKVGKAGGKMYVKEFTAECGVEIEKTAYCEYAMLKWLWPDWKDTLPTSTTPEEDPEAPPANRQRMSLRFDGKVINFRYYSKERNSATGRLLWVYREDAHYYNYSCKIDAETGMVIEIGGNVKLSMTIFIDEAKMRTYFAKCFSECGLSNDYMDKAEYTINYVGESATEPPIGAPTATVMVPLNDAGDRIEWRIADAITMCISSVKVKLADPNVYPDELADFYKPTYTE